MTGKIAPSDWPKSKAANERNRPFMHDPDRLDLPSASSASRRRRCTGSENLIRELRTRGLLKALPPSSDAESGTRSHAAWDGADVPLSAGEQSTVTELKRLEELVVADWASGIANYTLFGREVRLWLRKGISPIFSGQ